VNVAEIWRCPVKSMAGGRLDSAHIKPLGIEEDCVVYVEDARGHVITARTHHNILLHD
jgi:uncharacterized protein YcbX